MVDTATEPTTDTETATELATGPEPTEQEERPQLLWYALVDDPSHSATAVGPSGEPSAWARIEGEGVRLVGYLTTKRAVGAHATLSALPETHAAGAGGKYVVAAGTGHRGAQIEVRGARIIAAGDGFDRDERIELGGITFDRRLADEPLSPADIGVVGL